jgi:hypothetical protein
MEQEEAMKRAKAFWLGLLMAVPLYPLLAQRATAQRIYNKERDDQAQAAKKQAEEVRNGSVFNKQLQNLSVLSRFDFDTYFLGARRSMRADIAAFNTWEDVNRVVDRTERAVGQPPSVSPSQIEQARANLKDKIAATQKALARLKQKAEEIGNGEFASFFAAVGDVEFFEQYAEKLLGSDKPSLLAVKRITDMLDVLKEVYDSYTKKLDAISKVRQELTDLKVPLLRVALQRLQLEDAHWKAIGEIEARRDAEQEELRYLVGDYRALLRDTLKPTPSPTESVIDTINAAVMARDRERLANLMVALHLASALAARGTTPHRLSELRLAQEEHLYSIKQSALVARAYELTIETGVQRLALYHAGGVRPEQVARLIHTAATVAIPAAILAN